MRVDVVFVVIVVVVHEVCVGGDAFWAGAFFAVVSGGETPVALAPLSFRQVPEWVYRSVNSSVVHCDSSHAVELAAFHYNECRMHVHLCACTSEHTTRPDNRPRRIERECIRKRTQHLKPKRVL